MESFKTLSSKKKSYISTRDGTGSVSNRTEPNRTEPKSVRFELFEKSIGSVRFGSKLFRFGSVRFEENEIISRLKLFLYRTNTNKEKKEKCSVLCNFITNRNKL